MTRTLVLKKIRGIIRSYVPRLELSGLRTRPAWDGEKDRFSYQSKIHNFDIKPGEEVLDVVSGGDPFPYATMLVDLHTQPTKHRT